MNKREAGDIARAIRAAIKDHAEVDLYHAEGNFFIVPAAAHYAGRYNTDATAKQLATDILFIGGEA